MNSPLPLQGRGIAQPILHLSRVPSGLLTFALMKILEHQEAIDDPTASSAVHFVGGVVGTIATGLFVKTDERWVQGSMYYTVRVIKLKF